MEKSASKTTSMGSTHHLYSFVSNKRRVANKRRVWKKYQNLINVGSGTNEGPVIFVRLNKEIAENSHFFSIFTQIFNDFFQK